jgi:hypothetical protein
MVECDQGAKCAQATGSADLDLQHLNVSSRAFRCANVTGLGDGVKQNWNCVPILNIVLELCSINMMGRDRSGQTRECGATIKGSET